MLATSIIVLRELFEISLIISLFYALLKETAKSKSLIFVGIIIGSALSVFIGYSFINLSNAFSGYGQEILNIFVLSLSIILLFYTLITLNSYTSSLKNKLIFSRDNSIRFSIITLTALTVSREGTELFLFLYSSYLSGGNYADFIQGIFLGLIIALLVSVLVYKGIVILPTKIIFKIINIMLSLFAASMAAQLANYISELTNLDTFSGIIWNSSWLIAQESLTGKFLKTLLGYNATPSYLQFIFYITTLMLMLWAANYKPKKS